LRARCSIDVQAIPGPASAWSPLHMAANRGGQMGPFSPRAVGPAMGIWGSATAGAEASRRTTAPASEHDQRAHVRSSRPSSPAPMLHCEPRPLCDVMRATISQSPQQPQEQRAPTPAVVSSSTAVLSPAPGGANTPHTTPQTPPPRPASPRLTTVEAPEHDKHMPQNAAYQERSCACLKVRVLQW